MKIVADENIPFVREAFACLGDVETLPGRSITAKRLAGAELLLVRTVTQVDERLLDGSSVRFVGSATSGFDHVDFGYLDDAGIGFAGAAGANAASVAEYLVASLAELAGRFELQLDTLSVGIVGHGHVGKCVHRKAIALGMQCVINDPPLGLPGGDPAYRPLEEILACDIVTLHVPLEGEGEFATHRLVDEDFLAAMKPGAILINTSRGPVVDEDALKQALQGGHLRACVLDVWANEPNPDAELIAMAAIATPHIAGYSMDGRAEGTRRIFDEACAFLGVDADWDPAPLLPPSPTPLIELDSVRNGDLCRVLRRVYDIMQEDAPMRELAALDEGARPARFDALRRDYGPRREFSKTTVVLAEPNSELGEALRGLGFAVRAHASAN